MNDHRPDHPHDHGHDHSPGHGHTHGIVDPSIATSESGLWAIKWSFVGLAAAAMLQLFVVFISGSVALLADTIHNFGDAATAIPLAIAFWFGRKKPSERHSSLSKCGQARGPGEWRAGRGGGELQKPGECGLMPKFDVCC